MNQVKRTGPMPISGRGILLITDPELGDIERQTFTCCHCGIVRLLPHKVFNQIVKPGQEGGWCFRCNAYICRRRNCSDCTPVKARLYA